MTEKIVTHTELGDRIAEIARVAARRLTEDEKAVESTAVYIRQKVHMAVNDALENHKILKVAERHRVTELKKRVVFLEKTIENRDPENTKKLMETHGKNYVDFQKMELEALRWAIEFIEERTL